MTREHHDSDTQRENGAQSTKTRWVRVFLRDLVVIVVAAVVISVGIKTFLVRSFYVPSPSMNNTLLVNDRIVVNELVPRLVPLARGDVVVFTDPGGWLPGTPIVTRGGVGGALDWVLTAVDFSSADSNNHLVKRVIGLPGDTVACCNSLGQMTVNGVPLDESGYVDLPPGAPASAIAFSVTVPAQSLWVMGDNRNNSRDSRYHGDLATKGFVPYSDVVGRAFVIMWPIERWNWLDDYPRAFDGVTKK